MCQGKRRKKFKVVTESSMIERTFLKSRSRSTQTLTTHGVIWEIKTAVVSKGQPDCPRWVVCLSREEKARRHPCGHGVTGLPLWGGLCFLRDKGRDRKHQEPAHLSALQEGGHRETAAVKCMRVWPPIKARRKNLQKLPFLQLYVSAQHGVAILLFSSFQSNPSQETQLLKNLRGHHLTFFPSALPWYLCYGVT